VEEVENESAEGIPHGLPIRVVAHRRNAHGFSFSSSGAPRNRFQRAQPHRWTDCGRLRYSREEVPDTVLRQLLCDDAGQVRCPSCIALQRVDVMRAVRRDPLVACMRLACGHAWHATFHGDSPGEAQPCDCPQ
jgi:hypothetical protein